jgi:hypothetical protein
LLANVVLLVATTAVVTPWALRNYMVFDRFVPFSTNVGWMLILGNSEHAQPNSGPTTDVSKYRTMMTTQGFSEVERDSFYKSEAFRWIMQNKVAAAKLYILKLLTHFHFRNDLRTRAESTVGRDAIMFVTYYALLLLAIWRVFTGGSLASRPFETFAIVAYLMVGAAYAAFFTRIRYRLPVDWLLIAMASIFAASLLRSLPEKYGRRLMRQPRPL